MKLFLFTIVLLLSFISASTQTGNSQSNEIKGEHSGGIVRLHVVFLSSGVIGDISVLEVIPSSIPSDFIEQAVAAAKKLKFEPRIIDGKARSVLYIVEYTYTSFYDEDSPSLARKAVIRNQPKPKFPKGDPPANTDRVIKVTVFLKEDGTVEIRKIETDLPESYRKAAERAASRIKFDPAIHTNGSAVKQTKTIIYEVNRK